MNTGADVWNYTTFPYPDGAQAWVSRNGSSVELPVLRGGTSSWATAINNDGQIVGASTASDGKWHAVLWTHTGRRT
jgi:probable HAF family extracellular repeat protein